MAPIHFRRGICLARINVANRYSLWLVFAQPPPTLATTHPVQPFHTIVSKLQEYGHNQITNLMLSDGKPLFSGVTLDSIPSDSL